MCVLAIACLIGQRLLREPSEHGVQLASLREEKRSQRGETEKRERKRGRVPLGGSQSGLDDGCCKLKSEIKFFPLTFFPLQQTEKRTGIFDEPIRSDQIALC